MLVESQSKVSFGLFDADLQNGELWKAGKRIKIQSQPFKILAVLLERPGEVVSKNELQLRFWDTDTTVDCDHSLGSAINKIREALGDSAVNPRFIQTAARRGYRFIAPVGYPAQNRRNVADPSWSANGMSIAFGRAPDLMGKESGLCGIQILDLRTHALTVVPGSEGLFSPRSAPDGRYIAAISLDERKLMLFDVAKGTWRLLADTSVVDPVWTADSKAIYIHAFMEPSQPIYRIEVPSGHREQVADLQSLLPGNLADYLFSGITSNGVPLVDAAAER